MRTLAVGPKPECPSKRLWKNQPVSRADGETTGSAEGPRRALSLELMRSAAGAHADVLERARRLQNLIGFCLDEEKPESRPGMVCLLLVQRPVSNGITTWRLEVKTITVLEVSPRFAHEDKLLNNAT